MIAPLAGLKTDDYKQSRFRPRRRRSGSVTFGHAVYLKNMRKLVLVIALACLAAISLGGRAHAQTQKARVPVVLELFTSEGCSDCPPADALLGQLASQSPAGTEIIPLGFHVDYWDELGWHDRFSSRQFSWRQDQYRAKFETDSVYTPQMVVNGRFETVGSSSAKILNAIAHETDGAKPAQVAILQSAQQTFSITVAGAPQSAADVYLAITEDDLSTNVGAGENKSRTLHHTAVVRELRQIGSTKNGTFEKQIHLSLDHGWRPEKLHAVAFVQQHGCGAILGAARVPLSVATAAAK